CRQAEAAGHEPHLVVARGGELSQPGHDVDAGVELGLGQPDLAGEVMQMADKRLHDLPKSRVVGPPGLREHSLGQLQLVLNDHVLLLLTATSAVNGRPGPARAAATRHRTRDQSLASTCWTVVQYAE